MLEQVVQAADRLKQLISDAHSIYGMDGKMPSDIASAIIEAAAEHQRLFDAYLSQPR